MFRIRRKVWIIITSISIFFFFFLYLKGRGSQAATIARVYFGFEFFCLSSIYTICTKVRFREVLGQDGLVQLGG
jgi:hypothetical protein